MRQVNIRQLRLNLAGELKNLPFEIVRNGKVVGTVTKNHSGKDGCPTGVHIPGREGSTPSPASKVEKITDLKKKDRIKKLKATGFFNPQQKKGAKT